jgi:hypothetical protein
VTFGFIGWDERTGSRSEPPKYDGLGGAGAGMIARLLDRAIPCQQIINYVAAIADSRGDHHDCRRSACDRRHRSSASLTSWPAGWSSARTPAWSEGQTPSTGRSPISRTDRTRPAPLAVGSPTRTLSIRALGSPVAATYGLGRSQSSRATWGRHTARRPQEPGRAPSARSCVTRDAGCYGEPGAGRADG